MITKRICIYPKDIQMITGRSERYGRKVLQRIRQHLLKEEHHLVTVLEFCAFTGIAKEEVEKFIKD